MSLEDRGDSTWTTRPQGQPPLRVHVTLVHGRTQLTSAALVTLLRPNNSNLDAPEDPDLMFGYAHGFGNPVSHGLSCFASFPSRVKNERG